MKPSLPSLIVILLAATVAFGGGPLPTQRSSHSPKKKAPPKAAPIVRGSKTPKPVDPTTGGGPAPLPPWPTTTGSTSGTTGTTSTAGTTSGSTGATATTSGGETSGGTTATTSGSTAGTTSGSTGTTTGTTGTDTGGGTTAGGSTNGGIVGTGPTGWDASGDTPVITDEANSSNSVSGTNVNVEYGFTLRRLDPPDATYTDARLWTIDFKIGGEVDSTVVGDPSHPINETITTFPKRSTYRVRFASTRFNPGATIGIHAIAHYRFYTANGQSFKTLDVKSPTLTVTAYNQGLALATQLYINCQSSTYVVGESSPADYFNSDSQKAITAPADGATAKERLVQMRHGVNASPFLGKTGVGGVLDNLKSMTAFFGFTHGEPGKFLPSFGTGPSQSIVEADKLVYGSQYGSDSEVAKALYGLAPYAPGRSAPRPNMVVLHACNGWASGADRFMKAFGLMSSGGSTPVNGGFDISSTGRAAAAFDQVVDATLKSSTVSGKTHLSDHAKSIYERLFRGVTIGQAVTSTQLNFMPGHSSCTQNYLTQMEMTINGDPNARLISVYTGGLPSIAANAPPERPASEILPGYYPYRWYLVKP